MSTPDNGIKADSGTSADQTPVRSAAPAAKESWFHKLYVGSGAFDIIGKRKRWYTFFALLILVCIGSIAIKHFNLGIDFEGGTRIQLPAASASGPITVDQVKSIYQDAIGKQAAAVQSVGSGSSASIQIRSDALNTVQTAKLKGELTDKLHPNGNVSDSLVSATWGGEISKQALIALIVFLVLVTIFLSVYFERVMAMAALASVVSVVIITAGIYSLVGFELTPATVIGLLTILGFSLYDTVVVFDKVRENTRGLLGLTRRDFPEAANLAVNQTLMRSINTSLIALLPVLGLLVVGAGVLGVGTLQDLALVQLTGILTGTVSSICLATPLAVDLKMRDPKYQAQAKRVAARKATLARRAAAGAAGDVESTDDETLDAELREEKAFAAAAGVPARTPRASDARRGAGRPTGRSSARPTGKKRR
ncbi:protein translocase subunit SecF [Solihabitans fulvus]|uniref:Protein-export membrane protein SecF n=1 Tax=Solihabitans fulvus TaxID=1892852 RepID=A0A5B2XDZ3_9PSEU|nr:protein translocase subunit SecF [Solihabitans fulvus]KAA2261917.1 protein translocase subunit SecF [Solihabitans fulvus]